MSGQSLIGTRWEDRDWREQGRVLGVEHVAYPDGEAVVYLKTVESQKVGARPKSTMRLATLYRRFRQVATPTQHEETP